MEMDLSKRNHQVSLFHIGLGGASGDTVVIAAKNNMGKSIVGGKEIKDAPSQKFYDPLPIVIEPLNSIIDTTSSGDEGKGF
jgi:hypothetical protein